MRYVLLFWLVATAAQADIYKCPAANKEMIYQSAPCSADSVDKNRVDIAKPTPEEMQAAENRLKETEAKARVADKEYLAAERQQAKIEQALAKQASASARYPRNYVRSGRRNYGGRGRLGGIRRAAVVNNVAVPSAFSQPQSRFSLKR